MDTTISNNAREIKHLPPSASISKIQQLKDAKIPDSSNKDKHN
jgi:hypothetical protein